MVKALSWCCFIINNKPKEKTKTNDEYTLQTTIAHAASIAYASLYNSILRVELIILKHLCDCVFDIWRSKLHLAGLGTVILPL